MTDEPSSPSASGLARTATAVAVLVTFFVAIMMVRAVSVRSRFADERAALRRAAADARTATLVRVKAGSLLMGAGAAPPDGPEHRVIVESFDLDATEVTNAAFDACVAAGACRARPEEGPCATRARAPDEPATCVDWRDAAALCASAGKRLPTEAEWEYAARSTLGYAYPWGRAAPSAVGACVGTGAPCAVASRIGDRGPFEAWDMAGGVREWTSSPACAYPAEACAGEARAVRGGSFASTAAEATGFHRAELAASARAPDVGFRCARDAVRR